MYHTQERRQQRLAAPVRCESPEAWLGSGYYFWYDDQDAFNWGKSHKRNTGYFEMYHADINCDNILDTVFNEAHYKFWMSQVEKVARVFIKKHGQKPTIKDINSYFVERGIWQEVDGIMYQDIPENINYVMVISFYYRKRIQLVVYNPAIVVNFVFKLENKSNA